MEDENLENGILPDLPDEITGEQLVLQQKVFRKNEEFIKLHNGIIKWLRSDVNNRVSELNTREIGMPLGRKQRNTCMMKTARNYTSKVKEMMGLVMYRTIFVPLTLNTQELQRTYSTGAIESNQ